MSDDKKVKKFEFIPFIISIAIPLLIGAIAAYILPNMKEVYEELTKPNFAPPSFVFSIVWPILYILMGIAAYKVKMSGKYRDIDVGSAIFIYYIQLLLNFLWTIIFFGFRLYGLAFIELVILIIFVVITIKRFYKKSGKCAAILMMPYLIWLIYAGALNFYIWMLNEM